MYFLLAWKHDQNELINFWFFVSICQVFLNLKSIKNPLFFFFLAGSIPKRDHHSAFVAEVKRFLPPEKSVELFQTISSYKETGDYDKLAVDVVGLFKDNVNLLVSKLRSHVIL